MILREIKNMYFPALQRIEYLESTEDYMQYIDTGVKIDSETAFQGSTIDFQSLTLGVDDSVVVAGSVLSEGTHMYENTECLVFVGKFYENGGFDFSQYSDIYARTTATSNGKAKGISNLNLILFARNVKGIGIVRMVNKQRGGTCRIFSCTIRKNGDVIRDFIPVRIGTKGYMLDKVSGELYGNSGTGDFVLGQDVGYINYSRNLQQIYQNGLIEGVDYETYDWLRSTGGAQIELNYTNNGNFNLELKGKELETTGTDASQILGTTFAWSSSYLKIAIRKSTGNLMFENNSNIYPSAYQEFELKVINSSDSNYTNVIINGDTYTHLTKKRPLKLARLFYWYNGSITQHTEGCVGHLKVDNYCNMYPCKLLHSIPRNLDAQCKARQAGECGMIDLKTGQFHGNVASSGTFTVENDTENNE